MWSADEYLAHHGIKGQRWGVRRFRERDGDLTAAGRQRYGVGNGRKKSRHRVNLEEKYKKAGMSKEDAERAADKKIKIEKGVAISAAAGAATVAAIAIYKKYGEDYFDKTIKPGTEMQTLTAHKDRMNYGQDFYTAIAKGDKTIYKGLFGKEGSENKFNIKSVANSTIKVASRESGSKVFQKLFDSDKEFRDSFIINAKAVRPQFLFNEGKRTAGFETVKKVSKTYDYGVKPSKQQYRKMYELYNAFMVGDNGARIHKDKFYNALKNAGYGGVIDINDRKFSGFNAKSPTIIFDKAKTTVKSIEQLTTREILKSGRTVVGQNYLKELAPQIMVVGGITGMAGISGASNRYDEKVIKELARKRK